MKPGEESPDPNSGGGNDATGTPHSGGQQQQLQQQQQQQQQQHAMQVPRYPHSGARGPDGYYQPVYPPPADGVAAPPYPPPRGYEGSPYPMPPPGAGYPMYPYPPMPHAMHGHHQPLYPAYPGYPPMPPYGYPPPPDPSLMYPHQRQDRSDPYNNNLNNNKDPSKQAEEDEAEDEDPGVTARLKTYIKPRFPTTQDVLDRRERKNAQSRARAAKLRERVVEIEKMAEEDRTEEEQAIFLQFENRRQKKNDRSRERALEKKEEIDRILAKPEKKRSKIERQFLDSALVAKKRKNEGDRMRRQRLKQGVSSKGGGSSSAGSLTPPHPSTLGYPQPIHPYPPPPYVDPHHHTLMSPMPGMGAHSRIQSPGGFGSPGMMAGLGYPSPSRGASAGPSGVMETPGRSPAMPYMPPEQEYKDDDASRVEQRRHADGSMSISIGGGGAGAAVGAGVVGAVGVQNGSSNGGGGSGGEDPNGVNISDVSHLLLYDEGDASKDDGPPPPDES